MFCKALFFSEKKKKSLINKQLYFNFLNFPGILFVVAFIQAHMHLLEERRKGEGFLPQGQEILFVGFMLQ